MAGTELPPLPAFDGSVHVLPGFLDFHTQHSPGRAFCIFPTSDADASANEVEAISFKEFADATHRIAHLIRPPTEAVPEHRVVAILAHTDNVFYHAMVVGIIRAGLVPFPLAPRSSAPAIANLLERTQAHRVISQPEFSSLVGEIRKVLPTDYSLQVDALPPFTDVFPLFYASPKTSPDELEPYPSPKHRAAGSDIVLYLHSSGSTGFPKPIPQTNTNVLHWCLQPVPLETSQQGLSWAASMLPAFHTLGIIVQLVIPLASGQSIALFRPRAHIPAPPVVPTPEVTLEAIRRTECDVLIVVPSFLEAWAKNQDSIEALASLKLVTYCGGPLSTSAGDKLVAAGVRLYPIYGGTEFGGVTRVFDVDYDGTGTAKKSPSEWEWMQFPDRCELRWIPQGDNTYELCFMRCATHEPSVENLPNGERGYATSDLFTPHPTKPGLWRIVGRADDVITLSTGEKIVPIQQQDIVTAHPFVTGAVMFGRRREQVGILVEPHPSHAIKAGDERALVEFRNSIWPQVEQANRIAPAHGRIFKEMILVTDPSRPLVRAAKGTVIVKQTLALYEKDVDELYATVKDSAESQGIEPPVSWSTPDVEKWLVENAVAINDGKSPDVSEDLFQQGFDSLSATYLRNRIMGALRASSDPAVKAAAHSVQPNFVFAHPTLVSLATAVSGLVQPGRTPASTALTPVEQMEAMISKHTALLPQTSALQRRLSIDVVVLLTGSTGSLGAHILVDLLNDERISRVYAVNRGAALPDRQRTALEAAGLPTELLSSSKLVLLSGDIMRADLGLKSNTLDEIRGSVTHVIHNAWRVDFNLGLASFEPYIKSTATLVNLIPSAHFLFMSSIAAAQAWQTAERGSHVPEEPLRDPSVAVGTGYGMSKFVIEEILANARSIGYITTTVRIGQICGSTSTGAWNTSDWVPSLVKSSISLGCLPETDGVVSWIPMEAVSRAVIDVLLDKNPPPLVNVVHPHPAPSREVFSAVNEVLGSSSKSPKLPTVSWQMWIKNLETVAHDASEQDLTRMPAIKLLEFFRPIARGIAALPSEARTGEVEMGGLPLYDTAKIQNLCSAMKTLRPLGKEDAERWVSFWRKQRFIS